MAFLVWQSVKYPIAETEHGFNRMGLDEVHQILIVTIPVSGNQRLGGFIPLPTGAIQGLINIISKPRLFLDLPGINTKSQRNLVEELETLLCGILWRQIVLHDLLGSYGRVQIMVGLPQDQDFLLRASAAAPSYTP